MPAHYNLRSFLRQLSRELLKELFDRHGIETGLELSALKKRQIDPIFETINALSEDRRQKLDDDFRNILSLATPGGIRHIVEEARFQGFELIEELQPIPSPIDRAAWACLYHGPVFEAAIRLAVRELLSGRYWKRRLPIAPLPGAELDGAVKPLEAAISGYFNEQEGRGKACLVEYLKRANLHHFFGYPEDFPASPLAWTAQGLNPHCYRPAFEIVFVFDDVEGWLDIYCESGRETAERLRTLFAETVIALRNIPEVKRPAYRLEGLKSRTFQFIRPPDSPIKDVRLKRLGFAIRGEPTKISIETDPTTDRFAIHREMGRVFVTRPIEMNGIGPAQTKIVGATLTATIEQSSGRLRTRTFDITEKSCALKYDGHDLLLRGMLVASGIDITGRPDHGDGATRPAA